MKKENNDFKKEGIIKKLWEKLDVVIASGGVLLGLFIIYMSVVYEIHQYDIGGTIFIASALYILLRKKLLKASENFDFKPTWKFIYINNIVFFLIFSLSIWLLYTSLYSRSLIYFILVALACASIALEILYSNNKRLTGLILIKILLIGITLYGGLYYEFDDVYGVDTRFHNAIVSETIAETYIPSGQSYSYFPIFHLLSSSTSILTSLNVYNSIFSSITFLFVLSVVFVFLIGQKLINSKAGLLAALMLVFGDYRIIFGAAPIPMTLGIVLFTIVLHLFIVNTPKPLYRRTIVFFLLIVLVLTHTIAGFVMLVTLISLFIWKNINNYLNNISISKFTLLWSVGIAFCVMLLTYWMYAFQCPAGLSFFDQEIYSLHTALTQDAEFATGTVEKVSPYISHSYFEYLLDDLGYLIFLGIGIIGTYIWIKTKDEFKVSFCFTMVVLFALLYGFALFGLRNILSTRWFSFVYVILALVSAYGIFKLVNLINKKEGIAILVIAIFLISFFMITSTVSNDDNPLYNKEKAYRLGNKASELQGTATIHQIFNRTFKITAAPERVLFNVPCVPLDYNVTSLNYNFNKDIGEMYVLRKDAFKYHMVEKLIRNGIGIPVILDEEFKTRLEINSNKIYDNGEVWGYVIK